MVRAVGMGGCGVNIRMRVIIVIDPSDPRDHVLRSDALNWLHHSPTVRGPWWVEENVVAGGDHVLLVVDFRDMLDAHDFRNWSGLCRARFA